MLSKLLCYGGVVSFVLFQDKWIKYPKKIQYSFLTKKTNMQIMYHHDHNTWSFVDEAVILSFKLGITYHSFCVKG